MAHRWCERKIFASEEDRRCPRSARSRNVGLCGDRKLIERLNAAQSSDLQHDHRDHDDCCGNVIPVGSRGRRSRGLERRARLQHDFGRSWIEGRASRPALRRAERRERGQQRDGDQGPEREEDRSATPSLPCLLPARSHIHCRPFRYTLLIQIRCERRKTSAVPRAARSLDRLTAARPSINGPHSRAGQQDFMSSVSCVKQI